MGRVPVRAECQPSSVDSSAVCAQFVDDRLWQNDDPLRRFGLGLHEDEPPAVTLLAVSAPQVTTCLLYTSDAADE